MAAQLARIFFIDNTIRIKGKVTLRDIVEHEEVSESTAKRDIEALRDRVGAPIVYCRKIRGYKYEKEFRLLDFAGEQLFLFFILVQGLVKNQNYLPLSAEYSRTILIEKLKEIIPEDYAEISDRFSYFYSDYEIVDYRLFKTIIESMSKKKQLKLVYRTKSISQSERRIEPQKVICYGAKWYLAAYCYKREGIRLFSLSRVERLELLDDVLEQNNLSNDVDQLINDSFGIAKAEKVKTATRKFSEPTSYYVTNQIWHKDQRTKIYTENGNKVLELTLPYGMPEELIGKVLKYGATAEILSPKELREQWIGEIEGMWKKIK
ncbi:MAG: hypothetical protein SCALA702_00660 [Melioribacteraceae bacterium]|nr:MAG: hypothetical protein SCALA702_00660 [Melioribacteraceae bacterium]